MRITFLLPAALAAVAAYALPALAQSNRFAPVFIVNDNAVTGYELEQRLRFLKILGAAGDIESEAREGLIEDRLRVAAAASAGIKLTDQQIAAGMEEFAGRANLSTEQFLKVIEQAGVAPETFRDFVRSGIAWREVVRAKFGPTVAISPAEIDRATSIAARRGEGPRVLISEILIPVTPGTRIDKQLLAEDLVGKIRSEGEFARAARAYSAAPSRIQGGQIGWIPLTNLPPQVRQIAVQMQPGQVSPPVPVAGALAIIRMRGANQGGEIKQGDVSVDYAQLLIPGGRSPEALAEAARIRGEVDTCDDLYRVAKGLPADQLTRETRRESQLPADLAREIATLDDNEASTAVTRGNALVFLMLCRRTATQSADAATLEVSAKAEAAPAVSENGEAPPPVNPDLTFAKGPSLPDMSSELTNQRLGQIAEAYLQDLKANAVIRTP
jgi:peptidyl-prolyl cis-trans isomerase SurA